MEYKYLVFCAVILPLALALPLSHDNIQYSHNPICNKEKDRGECWGFIPRYLYVKEKGQCEQFLWSGCDGNANNFDTLEECKQTCITEGVSSVLQRHSHPHLPTHSTSGVCELPIDAGNCDEEYNRWGLRNGQCEEFAYSGCGGNFNRFDTKEECEERCIPRKPETQELEIRADPFENECRLPLTTGPCRGYFTRWGMENGVCREFIYGGCEGNANNFKTFRECEQACGSHRHETKSLEIRADPLENACRLPLTTGPCYGYFPVWGMENGVCREFIFGGCEGNANRFWTKEECENECGYQAIQTTGGKDAYDHMELRSLGLCEDDLGPLTCEFCENVIYHRCNPYNSLNFRFCQQICNYHSM